MQTTLSKYLVIKREKENSKRFKLNDQVNSTEGSFSIILMTKFN